MSSEHDRRTFIAAVASVTGLVAAGAPPAPLLAQGQARGAAAAPAADFDLGWFDGMKGRHKQAFDYGSWDLSVDAQPFRFVRNYLDSHRDVSKLESPDVNTAVGISRPAFPVNVSSDIWQKYKLGEHFKIDDPRTGKPAERNFILEDANYGVRVLQARGTVFWQCNVALFAVASELARAFGRQAQDVRTELIAGFNPGVKLQPSHMWAIGTAQEHGFAYMKA